MNTNASFIAEQAKASLQLWQAALLPLKQRYSDADFASLLAFLGIHCNLWPMWLKTCRQLGRPLSGEASCCRLADSELHKRPWLCLFNPMDEKSAWVLVGGSGLPDSSGTFTDLSHREVCMTLQTLAYNMQPVMYDKAVEVFLRWGVYDSDTSAGPTFGTVYVEAIPSFDLSDLSGKAPLRLPRLPIVACELLQNDFPFWFDSVQVLNELIHELVLQCISHDESLDLHDAFVEYAAALWSYLQESDIIHCSPFDSQGAFTWTSFFRRRDKSIKFHGVLILTGDHYPLWDIVQKCYSLA